MEEKMETILYELYPKPLKRGYIGDDIGEHFRGH